MKQTLHTAAVVLVVLVAVSIFTRNSSDAAITKTTAPARQYYLTQSAFTGDQALTACVSGYHFASFAEIHDPTIITYNSALGRTQQYGE